MTSRGNLLISATALIGLSLAAPASAWSAEVPVPVVATFSMLGDMVKRIGGALYSDALSGPDGPAPPSVADGRPPQGG